MVFTASWSACTWSAFLVLSLVIVPWRFVLVNAATITSYSACATQACLSQRFDEDVLSSFTVVNVTAIVNACPVGAAASCLPSPNLTAAASVFSLDDVSLCCASQSRLPNASVAFVFTLLSVENSTFGGRAPPLFRTAFPPLQAAVPSLGFILAYQDHVTPSAPTVVVDVALPFNAVQRDTSRRTARVAVDASSNIVTFANITTPASEQTWPILRMYCLSAATPASTAVLVSVTNGTNTWSYPRNLTCNATVAAPVNGLTQQNVSVVAASVFPTSAELELLLVPVTVAAAVDDATPTSGLRTATLSSMMVVGCAANGFNVDTLLLNASITGVPSGPLLNASAGVDVFTLGTDGSVDTASYYWGGFAATASGSTGVLSVVPVVGGSPQILVAGNTNGGNIFASALIASSIGCVSSTAPSAACAPTLTNTSTVAAGDVGIPSEVQLATWSDALIQRHYTSTCPASLPCPAGTIDRLMRVSPGDGISALVWNGEQVPDFVATASALGRFSLMSNLGIDGTSPLVLYTAAPNASLVRQPYGFGAYPSAWLVPSNATVSWANDPVLTLDGVRLSPGVGYTTTSSGAPRAVTFAMACLPRPKCRAVGPWNVTASPRSPLTFGMAITASSPLGPFLANERCKWIFTCKLPTQRVNVTINASFFGNVTSGSPPIVTAVTSANRRTVTMTVSGAGWGYYGSAFFTVWCNKDSLSRTITDDKTRTETFSFTTTKTVTDEETRTATISVKSPVIPITPPPATTTAAPNSTASSNSTTLAPNATTLAPNGTSSPNSTLAPNATTLAPNVTTPAPNATTLAPNATTLAPNGTSSPNSTGAPALQQRNRTQSLSTPSNTRGSSTATPSATRSGRGTMSTRTASEDRTRSNSHTDTNTRPRRLRTKTPRTRTANVSRSSSLTLTHQDTFTVIKGTAPPPVVRYVPAAAAASIDPAAVGIGIAVLVGLLLIGIVIWKAKDRIAFAWSVRRRTARQDEPAAPLPERTNAYRWWENAEEVAQDLERRGDGNQRSDHEGLLRVPTVTTTTPTATTRVIAEDPFLLGLGNPAAQPMLFAEPAQASGARSANPLARFGL